MDDKNQQGFLGNVVSWFQHPFQPGGSAFNWVLFVGLLIIAAFMWNLILIDIIER